MIVQVNPDDPTHIYEQIRSQILLMISGGTLAPGTQLPTIRQLASDLGLAKGTVSKAYEALLRDGAIESRGRHGTVVSREVRTFDSKQRRSRLVEATEQLVLTAWQMGANRDEVDNYLRDAWRRLEEGAA
jgi:DNA-binding transcriptional regulator YhcF (GntR family)